MLVTVKGNVNVRRNRIPHNNRNSRSVVTTPCHTRTTVSTVSFTARTIHCNVTWFMFTSLSGHFSFRLSVFVTLVTLLVEDYLLWSKCKTRMHSSRMCTARSLTVWRGCLLPGGGVSRGCLLPGGRGVVSQHALRQTPLWTESQTRVKT